MAWPVRQPSPGEVIIDRNHRLTKGLVGWSLFNEKGGTVLHDYSGIGNDGALTNMDPATDWVIGGNPAISGYALDFDGGNDHVNLGDNLDNDGTQEQTVTAWIRANVAETAMFVAKGDSLVPFTGWLFFPILDTTMRLSAAFFGTVNDDTDRLNLQTIDSISTLEWAHVAFTYDGSQVPAGMKLYMNGVQKSTEIVSNRDELVNSSSNSIDLQIGARDGTNLPFDGRINDMRIYNRALTPNEVMELYVNPFAGILRLQRKYFVPAVAGVIQKRRFLRRHTDPNFWLEW